MVREHAVAPTFVEIAEHTGEALMFLLREPCRHVLVEARCLERGVGGIKEDEITLACITHGILEVSAQDVCLLQGFAVGEQDAFWCAPSCPVVRWRVVFALGILAEQAVEAVLRQENEDCGKLRIIFALPDKKLQKRGASPRF